MLPLKTKDKVMLFFCFHMGIEVQTSALTKLFHFARVIVVYQQHVHWHQTQIKIIDKISKTESTSKFQFHVVNNSYYSVLQIKSIIYCFTHFRDWRQCKYFIHSANDKLIANCFCTITFASLAIDFHKFIVKK